VIRFGTSAVDEDEVGASPGGFGLEGGVEAPARLLVGRGVLNPAVQGAPVLRHPEVADGALVLALEVLGGGHLQAVLLHHEPRRRDVQRHHQEQRPPRWPPHPARGPIRAPPIRPGRKRRPGLSAPCRPAQGGSTSKVFFRRGWSRAGSVGEIDHGERRFPRDTDLRT
jgi:hypothetical protein